MSETDVSDKFSVALSDLVLTMLGDGYECKAPCQETHDLDAGIVAKWPCVRCKGQLHYEPFVLRDKDDEMVSYRAFMVCKVCGKVQEF